jgi:hypothetical protein
LNQVGLNKGETRNARARAVLVNPLDKLHARIYEEQSALRRSRSQHMPSVNPVMHNKVRPPGSGTADVITLIVAVGVFVGSRASPWTVMR